MPPIQPRFASAGNANESSEQPVNPIGLYRQTDPRQPGYGTEIGVLDPIQGDAVIRQGYELVEEGREAAMKSQKAMEADAPKADEKPDQPKSGGSK